jgi:membrane protease subunit HflC
MKVNKKSLAAVVIGVALLIAAFDVVYTVDQTEQAFVTQFGKPLGIEVISDARTYRFDIPIIWSTLTAFQPMRMMGVKKPGLHFKAPFIQKVIRYDRRILMYDARPESVYIKDNERLDVDFFVKWRIVDPLLFYRAVGTVEIGLDRLRRIIQAALKAEMGQQDMQAILSARRQLIMRRVREYSDQQSRSLGIQVVDVRIKRAELPVAIRNRVYDRMRAERKILAAQYRASGMRQRVEMEAGARLDRARILAQANRDAKVIRGDAEAQAAKTYVDVYKRDPELYRFVRSLEAYVKAFTDKTTVVLDGDNQFMKYFLPKPETNKP